MLPKSVPKTVSKTVLEEKPELNRVFSELDFKLRDEYETPRYQSTKLYLDRMNE